jgi:hypothetical protein
VAELFFEFANSLKHEIPFLIEISNSVVVVAVVVLGGVGGDVGVDVGVGVVAGVGVVVGVGVVADLHRGWCTSAEAFVPGLVRHVGFGLRIGLAAGLDQHSHIQVSFLCRSALPTSRRASIAFLSEFANALGHGKLIPY